MPLERVLNDLSSLNGESNSSDRMWCFKFHKNSHAAFYSENKPCWFHRVMQKFLLGIYWEQVKDTTDAWNHELND